MFTICINNKEFIGWDGDGSDRIISINGNKDWKETYREYCTDAFVERGEDTFTLEEVMVCTYSMFQNNAVHNHEAKFWIENGLV